MVRAPAATLPNDPPADGPKGAAGAPGHRAEPDDPARRALCRGRVLRSVSGNAETSAERPRGSGRVPWPDPLASLPPPRRDQPPGGWQHGGSAARDHPPLCCGLATGAPRLDRPHHPLRDWAARRGHDGASSSCSHVPVSWPHIGVALPLCDDPPVGCPITPPSSNQPS